MSASGHQLYESIIEPIRQVDKAVGGELLRRYLLGPQSERDLTESEILLLPDQIVPSKVRSDLLKYLKDIVGFTSQLRSITDRLTEQQLRRLISLAIPLWNQRATDVGIINAIRLLTGRDVVYSTWFYFRFLLGEAIIAEEQKVSGGDSWIIGGATSEYDEYWSNIRLMDDGTLDELLLLDIMKLERPSSECMEVFITDFLDNFHTDLSLGRWTKTDGSSDQSIVAEELLIPAGTEIQPIIPILTTDAEHYNYVVITKFRLTSASSIFRVRWYWDYSNSHYYQLDIQTASPRIVLKRSISGSESTLFSSDAPDVGLVHGVDYKLRVQTYNVGLDRHIRVYIDNIPVVPGTDTDFIDSVVNPSAGPYRFKAITDSVTIDNVESWRMPARFATITLSTLSERGGKVTMSSNFVQ